MSYRLTNFPTNGIKIYTSCCELSCNDVCKFMKNWSFVYLCDIDTQILIDRNMRNIAWHRITIFIFSILMSYKVHTSNLNLNHCIHLKLLLWQSLSFYCSHFFAVSGCDLIGIAFNHPTLVVDLDAIANATGRQELMQRELEFAIYTWLKNSSELHISFKKQFQMKKISYVSRLLDNNKNSWKLWLLNSTATCKY